MLSIIKSWLQFFTPFTLWLKQVNRNTLKADLLAGLTGAVIVLPQGVAFATIAGLPPEYGLYTAMVTPIIAALFGSSLHLISGPTTAISIVIYSTLSHSAEPGSAAFIHDALTITFLAGVYQVAFAFAKLGVLINFVSHTVIIGFTAGAAVLIATSQMQHILAVTIPRGESFLSVWYDIFDQFSEINLYVLSVALVTLAMSVLIKIVWPKLPHLLIGLLSGSLLAVFIFDQQHGIVFVGEIPAHLPPLSVPDISLETINRLAPQAFAVALLGLIEAVSISRSIASKSHQQIDSNQEFFGQGVSNIAGSFFSSYAGSGSFTRSGINYNAGAKTPLSAIFAAIFLALIVLLVAPLTAYLPVAAMGGIILLVAYHLIDFHPIKKIFRTSKSESSILLTTFIATLFLELEFAIYLGVLLSLVLFLARTSVPDVISLAPELNGNPRTLVKNATRYQLPECPQLKIVRIDMSIYFGSSQHIQSILRNISEQQKIKHILIVSTGINFIDLSGAEMLEQEARRLQKIGGNLYFTDLKYKVFHFVKQAKLVDNVGANSFYSKKEIAIRNITTTKLDQTICHHCQLRVFNECHQPPLFIPKN